MKKYQVKVREVLERTIEVEHVSELAAKQYVEEKYKKSEIVLDDGDFTGVTFTVDDDGLPFLHPQYQKNIMETLKDIPDDKRLYFKYQPCDSSVSVTKATLIETARTKMEHYFLHAMHNVKIDENGYDITPCFNRIEQAAWDAALSEFYKDKQEWCDKYGCE